MGHSPTAQPEKRPRRFGLNGRTRRAAFQRLRGTVAVEYALILPALLLFVLGLMDTGRLLWTQTTLDRSVQAAARCGAVDTTTCGTTSEINAYAVTQAFGLTITSAAFSTTTPACGVQVTASVPFTFVIPWIGTNTITLSAAACYPT